VSTPRTRTHTAEPAPAKDQPRPVSKRHDRHEREAERAADVVVRGGSVAGWSFSAVGPSAAPVQRQDDGKPKSDDEKRKEALSKAGEAFLETKPGKQLKEKVLADPLVKAVKDAATSPVGIGVTTAVAGGGVAALAATHKPLPFQPPSIPLDKVTPGLSAQVKYEGPVDRPTFVGLTLTYKEQGGAKGKGPSKSDEIAADTARLRAQAEMFKPAAQKHAEQREADEFVQAWVRSQQLPAVSVPLVGTKPSTTEGAPKKDETDTGMSQAAPVQRSPASATPEAAPPGHADVGDALAAPGRALDPRTRRSMEQRFGQDFSNVRIHDDARAAATAADIDAAAFTVGQDIVFAEGRFNPGGEAGTKLLAHELAHVVQQTRGAGAGTAPLVQRRDFFESVGILLGLGEGTWEDRELHDYLDAVVRVGHIEGSYDSDNKARAIIRRWKTSTPGFDLLAPQKILLIEEMLDGPTLGEDEECILDVLERSDASDLRAILAPSGVALTDLESDINGDNRRRLDTFVAHRFRGGRDAVLAGRLEVVGPTVPAGAPAFGFDPATLDARFDSDRSADDLNELVAAMPGADRERALHHLGSVRRPRQLEAVERLERQAAAERDPQRRRPITAATTRAREAMLKTERVILRFFREAVPATTADLRSGTQPSDPARQAEIRDALHPPTHQTTSGAAPFRSILPGESQSYEDKVRVLVPTMVDEYYDQMVTGRGPAEHADPARTHTLVEYEGIGNAAKDEVDDVFGAFYTPAAHPPLRADRPGRRGNVHDQFVEKQRELAAMSPAQRADVAKSLLLYFFQSDARIRRLNQDHDATPRFDARDVPQNDEGRALDRVASAFIRTAANVRRLDEIERNWPAEAQPRTRDIFFQVFRGSDRDGDRLLLWDVFQTFIHEYMHTLAHPDYQRFASTFGESSNENNTLMEGVDSLLTETVWSAVEARVTDPALRRRVEGAANAALPAVQVPHASQRRYDSFTEALHLAELVGIRNVYAAYFLGLVDRIGGPPPRAAAGGRTP
jgi:hypothetical protein